MQMKARSPLCSPECRKEYPHSIQKRYDDYKAGAKARGKTWNLTEEEFSELWQKPCVYCGAEIKTIGVDRVVNEIGYEVGNIVPCCTKCNMWKCADTLDDLIKHCRKIVETYESR